jgi:hypothetical protein
MMHRSGHHQEGSNVDTLALSQTPFESFIRLLQRGCMLLAEPSYLSCPAPMTNTVVRMLLPEALPVVVQPQLAPDQTLVM